MKIILMKQLIKEEYNGIRPAPGYTACPDHTEKKKIFKLLNIRDRSKFNRKYEHVS